MKKIFLFASLFTFTLFMVSCGSDEATQEEADEEIEAVLESFTDDANAEVTAADTSSTGVYQEEVDETEETSLQDAMKNNNKTEVIEEGAMSFCDCVKKNKELNDLMMETEDDAVLDKVMKDLEGLRTGECKILFEGKQNTIEEKQAHERKVKRCL
jgi:hypothetical protein